MVDRKRPPFAMFMITLLVGVAGLLRVTQSPSFGLYRTVDVIQLLGSGVCFGVTMVGIGIAFRHRQL